MKKYTKILPMILLFLLLYAIPANAQVNTNKVGISKQSSDESMLLPPWEVVARDIKNNYLRGSIVSTGIAEIGNKGGGDISVVLQTLAHVECDEIRHKGYLDRWDEQSQTWNLIDTYMFVETKDDNPDDFFTSLTTEFTILNQPTGYYYRLRGIHMATYGTRTEVISSRTDGVFITKD